MNERVEYDKRTAHVSIYEVHLGSWKQKFVNRNEDETPMEAFNSYKGYHPAFDRASQRKQLYACRVASNY